jgi:hypothetical protein
MALSRRSDNGGHSADDAPGTRIRRPRPTVVAAASSRPVETSDHGSETLCVGLHRRDPATKSGGYEAKR